jgi:hypothetical protein
VPEGAHFQLACAPTLSSVASYSQKQVRRCGLALAKRLRSFDWGARALGSGAPLGNKKGVKHGLYTREAIKERRQLQGLMRRSRILFRDIR